MALGMAMGRVVRACSVHVCELSIKLPSWPGCVRGVPRQRGRRLVGAAVAYEIWQS